MLSLMIYLFEDYNHFIMFITSILDPYSVDKIEGFFLLNKNGLINIVFLINPLYKANTVSILWSFSSNQQNCSCNNSSQSRGGQMFFRSNNSQHSMRFSGPKNNNRGSLNPSWQNNIS